MINTLVKKTNHIWNRYSINVVHEAGSPTQQIRGDIPYVTYSLSYALGRTEKVPHIIQILSIKGIMRSGVHLKPPVPPNQPTRKYPIGLLLKGKSGVRWTIIVLIQYLSILPCTTYHEYICCTTHYLDKCWSYHLEQCCARSRYQGQGQVITLSVECNYFSLPLITASDTTLLICGHQFGICSISHNICAKVWSAMFWCGYMIIYFQC